MSQGAARNIYFEPTEAFNATAPHWRRPRTVDWEDAVRMLSDDDVNLGEMSDAELEAAWDLWFDLAQATNEFDPPYTFCPMRRWLTVRGSPQKNRRRAHLGHDDAAAVELVQVWSCPPSR